MRYRHGRERQEVIEVWPIGQLWVEFCTFT